MAITTRVLWLRRKDKHATLLRELAREVNFVWNYCAELSLKVWQREGRFLLDYDFHPFTKGAGKAGLHLYSKAIQAIVEMALARTQRARKKGRVRVLHAKIKNSRQDQPHKLSTALVEEYGAIFIGNVNATALARIRMAKSVLDAAWSLFRIMLQYRSDHPATLQDC